MPPVKRSFNVKFLMKKEIKYHPPVNTAIVGFGFSGKVFHAPFVRTNPCFELHTIVSKSDDARELYPQTSVVSDFDEVLNNPEVEMIVICTPHWMHCEQACKALDAGKHVIVEKPVAMSSSEMEQIMAAAENSGKLIFPYHNRRWDGDFLTIRHLIEQGFLGEVMDFESRFDRYNPEVKRAEWRYNDENGGGTLFDLAPHLIDQTISLFGKPESVWCQLRKQRKNSCMNDSFDLKLIYPKLTASLRAGVFMKEPGPRFQVHGSHGSFVKYGLDTQEDALKNGKMPGSKNFGADFKKSHGILHSAAKEKTTRLKYPTFHGHYMGFYEDVNAALSGDKTPEVTAEDAFLNVKVIEAAMKSHEEQRNVQL
jgi:scyllo-inositol 2-dehydrogenase (NADP+)